MIKKNSRVTLKENSRLPVFYKLGLVVSTLGKGEVCKILWDNGLYSRELVKDLVEIKKEELPPDIFKPVDHRVEELDGIAGNMLDFFVHELKQFRSVHKEFVHKDESHIESFYKDIISACSLYLSNNK